MDASKLKKRGRVSAREQIEERLGIPMRQIFETHFKGLKTPEEIVKKFSELTNGEIKTGSATIIKTLLNCVREHPDLNLNDYPFACAEKKERGAHFRENSFRAKIEKAAHKTLWDVIDDYSKLDVEGILDQIQLMYNIKAEKPALLNAIKAGIENKEITEDRYERIMPTPRKRKTIMTPEGDESENQTALKRVELMVTATCTECDLNDKWKTTTTAIGICGDLALKGRKCKSCGKWGSLKATFTLNGKKIIKQVVHHDGVDAEEFVDKSGQIIENPLVMEDLG